MDQFVSSLLADPLFSPSPVSVSISYVCLCSIHGHLGHTPPLFLAPSNFIRPHQPLPLPDIFVSTIPDSIVALLQALSKGPYCNDACILALRFYDSSPLFVQFVGSLCAVPMPANDGLN